MKNKNKKIIIFITGVILTVVFVIFFFNAKDQNFKEKILVKNIQYNGEKISLIEKIEKEEGKTSFILKSKKGERQIDEFFKNNEIPDRIIDVFTFKSKKDEYIIAIINSYVKVNNEVFQYDDYDLNIYIYNSNGTEMHKVEQNFYLNENMEYQEFDFSNRNIILQKLQSLEKEGYL